MLGIIIIFLVVEVDEEIGEIIVYNGDEVGILLFLLGIKVKLYLDDLRDVKIMDNGGFK